MTNCIICLEKTKNRICHSCKCYAHPKCYGKYLQKTTKIKIVLHKYKVRMYTPMGILCPQCRGVIFNVKRVTRSDTYFCRAAGMIKEFQYFLEISEQTSTKKDKELIASIIFSNILRHKFLLQENSKFFSIFRRKLEKLYKENKWKPANIYYYQLFGKQISL